MRTALIIHTGVADQINCNGLVRKICFELNNKIVLIDIGNCTEMLKLMYSDIKNIEIFTLNHGIDPYNFSDNELLSFTNCNNIIRVSNRLCKMPNNSFVEAFYMSIDFDIKLRWTNFNIPTSVKDGSINIYNNIVNTYGYKYILIHEEIDNKRFIGSFDYGNKRGSFLSLDRRYFTENIPIINLDGISSVMLDYYESILNAYEIHLIDSAWANLIYILTFTEKRLQDKKIVLHLYARSQRCDFLYLYPRHDNWVIIN